MKNYFENNQVHLSPLNERISNLNKLKTLNTMNEMDESE